VNKPNLGESALLYPEFSLRGLIPGRSKEIRFARDFEQHSFNLVQKIFLIVGDSLKVAAIA
jgi:hypothetical protein